MERKEETPMQFGLMTLFDFFPDRQNEVRYYKDTLGLMIDAEQLGFDSVWVGEEHFYSLGICPSPQLFLTVLARETTRIRLGTAVSVLSLEHPLRKAEDYAMLDILSHGRLLFGAGRGAYPKHFDGFRVPVAENRQRYEEALEIIQQAWTHERFSYDGQFWQIPDLAVSPRPVQQPHPPIYLGIASPEAFEMAGVKGHGALLVPWLTPEPILKQGLETYRAALRAHGHTPLPTVAVQFLFIDDNYHVALADAREAAGRYARMVASAIPAEIVASLPPTDALRTLQERLVSLVDHIEERAIIGTPQDCRRRIVELREEYGIEHMPFYFHAGARDLTRARRGLELFANEVMPAFR